MKLIKYFIVIGILACGLSSYAKPQNKGKGGEPKVFGELDGKILATGSGRIVLLDSDGKELWTTKGSNCHDAWMLDNGNVLFADGKVKEINPKTNEVVFEYNPKVTKGGGTFSCQRLKNGNTLVGENSTGRILELDPKGKVVFELKTEPYKAGNHQNLRMVRKLENGNYLVCHSGAKLVREYTPDGKIVYEVKVKKLAFSASRLKNGNTIVGDLEYVTEYSPEGKVVWELTKKDLPGLKIGKICGVNVLPNGNMVLGIYAATQSENGAAILEVSRDKKVIWRYVKIPKGDRSMMSAQKLTKDGKAISNIR